jgi:MFS family permease
LRTSLSDALIAAATDVGRREFTFGFTVPPTMREQLSVRWLRRCFWGLHPSRFATFFSALPYRQRRERGTAYGWYHGAIGIGALPASLLFGLVRHKFGSPTAFAMGAGLAAVASLRLLRVRPETPAGSKIGTTWGRGGAFALLGPFKPSVVQWLSTAAPSQVAECPGRSAGLKICIPGTLSKSPFAVAS